MQAAPTAHEETVHGAGHTHPGDGVYMLVALFLAVLTGLEVSLYYIKASNDFTIPALIVLMVIKFGTVALWFMHLRFDNRMFRRLFLGGLILAVLVYLAFLTAMQLWGTNTTAEKQSLPAPAVATI